MDPTVEAQRLALEKLVASMDKAFRSFRLYEARGPQYEAHVREMASQAALATEQGPAVLTVTPHGLLVGDDKRAKEPELNRTWFDLFEQGARQVIFTPGIETAEVREMLQIMAGDHQGEDILTVLWRRELNHIQISVARTLVRGHRAGATTAETLEAQYGHWRNRRARCPGLGAPVQISPDDLGSSPYRASHWVVVTASPPSTPDLAMFAQEEGDLDELIGMLLSCSPRRWTRSSACWSVPTPGRPPGPSESPDGAHEDHPALEDWSIQRMVDAAGGVHALIPLIEAGPEAFRDSLATLANADTAMIEELLKEIETDSVREQVESLVITAESAPLAFHSARLQMAPVEEQLESVKALFDIGTEEAIYLATGLRLGPLRGSTVHLRSHRAHL